MKLLLDENLSRRMVPHLQEGFPGTTQVAVAGLERATDREVHDFAHREGFVIVTKDDDFNGLLALLGYPPKVIHLRLGNCTNNRVIRALLDAREELERLIARDDIGLVELD